MTDGRTAVVALSPKGQILGTPYLHGDLVGSSGKGMALLFWAFAFVAIGGSIFVITRRNLIAAVMGMVGSFMGIAAIYMMLYASFLSVIQMLVYAGAIMVLFVFVIMILNWPEDEPGAPGRSAGDGGWPPLPGLAAVVADASSRPTSRLRGGAMPPRRATTGLHRRSDRPVRPGLFRSRHLDPVGGQWSARSRSRVTSNNAARPRRRERGNP